MREIALHLMDLIANSISADADLVRVRVAASDILDRLSIDVIDNGVGMLPEECTQAADPFYTLRPTRGFGFGLALLEQSTKNAGGHLSVSSRRGRGTHVHAQYQLHHINRPPLGDLAGTLYLAITCSQGCDFIVQAKPTGQPSQRISTFGRNMELSHKSCAACTSLHSELLRMFPPALADTMDEALYLELQKGERSWAEARSSTSECR